MKRLVRLALLEPQQHDELVELLRTNGVRFQETPAGLLRSGAILVGDGDFERARELLRAHSQAFAEEARKNWEEEWRTQHGQSAARWFFNRLRGDPLGVIGKVILLAAAVGLFAIYPAWYVIRWAMQ